MTLRHGTAATYKAMGCRCDSCREAATQAMRRYRAGVRSPWGRGRGPSRQKRVVLAARAAYEALTRDRDGYSDFDHIVAQEQVAALGRSLAEIA